MRSRSSASFDPSWAKLSDPLATVLLDLRVSGSFFCIAELGAPWGVELPSQIPARFHFVAEGRCFLRRASERAVVLDAGDLVLMPRGDRHVLSDRPDGHGPVVDSMPLVRIGAGGALLRHGGDGARTVLVCSKVQSDGLVAQMLMDVMPAALIVRAADHGSDTIRAVLQAMTSEVVTARPGGATVVSRLADVVVIHAIRSWLQRAPATKAGWLRALRDPQVGRAIALVHQRPEEAWSVASLAAAVALSRSAFAERFGELVGTSPMQYVTRLRMHRANELMRSENLSVAQLADRLGYESEPAFSRAFKRHMGVPPGAARQQIQAAS